MDWFNRLMRNETSTLNLTEGQWARIKQAMIADTVWIPNGNIPIVSHADSIGPKNVGDWLDNTYYAYSQEWNFGGTSWGRSLGRVWIYYDANGVPVALKDDYDWNPDPSRPNGWLTEQAIAAIANGTQNRKFAIRYKL